MIDLTLYFVTNNIFGISLRVHACLAIILFKQTRDHGKTFSQKRNLLLITIINTMF